SWFQFWFLGVGSELFCRQRSLPADCGVACDRGEFLCAGGRCILYLHRCDGHDDCGDLSDERGCVCAPGEFQCPGDQCVPAGRVCDGRTDCPSGTDEAVCPSKGDGLSFACADGTCVSETQLCDGAADCPGGEDENLTNCYAATTTPPPPPPVTAASGTRRFSTGAPIPRTGVGIGGSLPAVLAAGPVPAGRTSSAVPRWSSVCLRRGAATGRRTARTPATSSGAPPPAVRVGCPGLPGVEPLGPLEPLQRHLRAGRLQPQEVLPPRRPAAALPRSGGPETAVLQRQLPR
uniref:Uncharacterized protein n=1 Tax=Salarias fasciatus TaxID=181472 RepID=A0A672F823_SALFA